MLVSQCDFLWVLQSLSGSTALGLLDLTNGLFWTSDSLRVELGDCVEVPGTRREASDLHTSEYKTHTFTSLANLGLYSRIRQKMSRKAKNGKIKPLVLLFIYYLCLLIVRLLEFH